MHIEPSILSADFANLGRDIEMLNGSKAYAIHLDIMDGSFVPNISFGFPVVKAVADTARLSMDAHLMVVHPERWFDTLIGLGVKTISFHLEAAGCRTMQHIRYLKNKGVKVGVAIDPDVPVKKLFKYIGKADFFLIMSVFAGFGGQKFIYESIDRVSELKAEIDRRNADTEIQVDGGVGTENASVLKEAGAGNIVAGSAVFKAENPLAVIDELSAI